MTIHHDKLAYGKLSPAREEIGEAEILKMLQELKDEEQEKTEKTEEEKKKKK